MTDVLTNSIRLVAVASAVSAAREFTANVLRLRGVPDSIADDACLITSELVTNAVKATGTLETKPSLETLTRLPIIGLKLTRAEERLLVEVTDMSNAPPQIEQQCEGAEGGRGLFLVTMLAERWSYYLVETGGKVVWAELLLPDDGLQNNVTAETTNEAPQQVGPLSEQQPRVSGHVAAHSAASINVAVPEQVLWGLQVLDR